MKIKISPQTRKIEFQDQLEPNIWDGETLNPTVREALLKIVDEFFKTLKVDAEIEDIRFTGSLANYNYTENSDIDLHLVVDFLKVDENSLLVKNLFDSRRIIWNRKHAITVKGYEVEVYIENTGEKHVSTGIYSVSNDEWIVKPSRTTIEIDLKTPFKKANRIKSEIDAAIQSPDSLEDLQRIKEKIKKMRTCGLEHGGIFSAENLAFKLLRNAGDIDRLSSAITKEYDRQHSLPEEVSPT